MKMFVKVLWVFIITHTINCGMAMSKKSNSSEEKWTTTSATDKWPFLVEVKLNESRMNFNDFSKQNSSG